jgi:hypothetical protein
MISFRYAVSSGDFLHKSSYGDLFRKWAVPRRRRSVHFQPMTTASRPLLGTAGSSTLHFHASPGAPRAHEGLLRKWAVPPLRGSALSPRPTTASRPRLGTAGSSTLTFHASPGAPRAHEGLFRKWAVPRRRRSVNFPPMTPALRPGLRTSGPSDLLLSCVTGCAPGARAGLLLISILLALMPRPVRAQYPASTIAGSVFNEDGNPLPDTQIRWVQEGREISILSGPDGQFYMPFVSPGLHRIKFQHPSASNTGVYDVTVGLETTLRLAVRLRHPTAQPDSREPTWSITELHKDSQDVWPPERVLTDSSIGSLPGTGHLWSILANTEPSVVSELFDVSGMHSQSQFLIGVRGSSWSQNQDLLNGLTVAHPAGDGMLLFPDLSAMEAVVYTIGNSPASHTGPGAHISMIPKTGQPELHGQSYFYFQGGALQNVNPTGRDIFFGIAESDERWHHFLNGGFQLGGPLGRLPWTYFGSLSARDFEKQIRNQTLPVSAHAFQGTFDLSGKLSARDQLGLFWSGQRLHEPQAEASPQITRESSLDQRRTYQSIQSAWTRYLSASSLLDVRLGVALGREKSLFQPGSSGQSRENMFAGYALYGAPDTPSYLAMVDMLNNTITGPNPLAISSSSSSTAASVAYSFVRPGFWNSNHRASLGATYHRASITQDDAVLNGVNLLFFEGAPNSVRLLNTPARTRDRVHQWELYASEALTRARLSIAFGGSVDFSRGANLLNSGPSTNNVNWSNLAGRFGAAYRIMDKRPLILRAGVAQIYDQPLTSTWTALNPNGLGERRYTWNDINGDGIWQKGENTQILKVSGAPYTRLDPSLKNPRTAELTWGLTQALPGGISFHWSAFRRFEHRLMSLVNEGVPFSSYVPLQVLDPGPDSVVGTGDDRYITVYNQKSETLGQDRYLLTNPPGFSGFSEGMVFRLTLSTVRVQAEAAMTRYRAVAATAPGISARQNDTSALLGVFDDPNKAIFARGSTYFDRGTLGRLWLTADLGWQIRGALLLVYQDGLPYSRYLPVAGLNQGLIGVLTSQRGPGAAGSTAGPMTAHYETIDMRLRREWSLGRGKLATILDVFNLMDRAQPLVQMGVTAPTQYWRIPLSFETPRSLQLGLAYAW